MPTKPSQFRLSAETLSDLDRIKKHLSETGQDASRADAIRVATRDFAQRLGGKKKSGKKAK